MGQHSPMAPSHSPLTSPLTLGPAAPSRPGAPSAPGAPYGGAKIPSLGQAGANEGLEGTIFAQATAAPACINYGSTHECRELASPQRNQPNTDARGSVPPQHRPLPTAAHLTSSFTGGSSQAGGAHGAGRTALARGTGGTLLAGFTLRRGEDGGVSDTGEHPPPPGLQPWGLHG